MDSFTWLNAFYPLYLPPSPTADLHWSYTQEDLHHTRWRKDILKWDRHSLHSRQSSVSELLGPRQPWRVACNVCAGLWCRQPDSEYIYMHFVIANFSPRTDMCMNCWHMHAHLSSRSLLHTHFCTSYTFWCLMIYCVEFTCCCPNVLLLLYILGGFWIALAFVSLRWLGGGTTSESNNHVVIKLRFSWGHAPREV